MCERENAQMSAYPGSEDKSQQFHASASQRSKLSSRLTITRSIGKENQGSIFVYVSKARDESSKFHRSGEIESRETIGAPVSRDQVMYCLL